MSGWEGSASDSRVLRDALSRDNGFKVPHAYQWKQGLQPLTKEELFNLRHDVARNIIELCFEMLKMRWAILRSSTWYDMRSYNKIVLACCSLHNLIRKEMARDYAEEECKEANRRNAPTEAVQVDDLPEDIATVDSSPQWNMWRDNLAQEMFDEWIASRQ
ncbi:uncharacterized protein [Rutidosis leptorrhynchoides]|uniref:uncharacterized protein n=1 Tax=Rutidosis leptorrhynchoides TaxID=125765 RepID=UPI003A98FED2